MTSNGRARRLLEGFWKNKGSLLEPIIPRVSGSKGQAAASRIIRMPEGGDSSLAVQNTWSARGTALC